MELKTFFAQDAEGNVIYAPTVSVYLVGTETLASGLKKADNTSLSNPFTGGTDGKISFRAPNGEYSITVEADDREYTLDVGFIDAAEQVLAASNSALAAYNSALAAATSVAQAEAIVVSGDVSYDPLANQVPLARSNGKIDPQWIQGAAATRNSVEAGTATTGLLIPDTTEYVFTPAMTRVFNVFIPETLTSEIIVYTHGTDGIYITTERRIRLNCGGGFYESDILPASVLGDSLEIAISRADNEASTVTVFFVVNGVQFGATQVSAFSDLYIRSLLVGIDGFFLTVSPGTAATTNAGTTRVSNPAEAIGLLYDGGPNGINPAQATGTARPLIGRVPVGGVRNRFQNSSGPYSTVWSPETDARMAVDTSLPRSLCKYSTVGSNGFSSPRQLSVLPATDNEYYLVRFQMAAGPDVASINEFVIGDANESTTANRWHRAISKSTMDWTGGITGSVHSTGRIDLGGGFYEYWMIVQNLVTTSKHWRPRITGPVGTKDLLYFGTFSCEKISSAVYVDNPYQTVLGRNTDVSQVGLANVWHAFFDLSDDILTTTVPAITNGTIVIAGTNGIWIDTLTVSAGTFNIGATTHTGGPAGLLAVVGNVIGAFVINRSLTAPEQAAIVAYYKAKGSPGFFELGAELVTNGTFDTDITGWVPSGGATLTWDASGQLSFQRVAASSEHAATALSVATGEIVLVSATVSAGSGSASMRLRANISTTDSDNLGGVGQPNSASAETFRGLITSTGTAAYLALRYSANTTRLWDNISVKKLTLNTGA